MRLPIDEFLPEILDRVRAHRAVVVVAAPGAGKTTRVPPALIKDGPVILLQPRRVAARSIARRIAQEQRWTVGEQVGWQVRGDRQFTVRTQLLVATEGVLTARLQQDPLISEFRTVILDEFHERSIHADLGIALARQAWVARDDLRIVIMSATMEAERTAGYLGDCPIVDVPGRSYPLTIDYRPEAAVAEVVEGLQQQHRSVLCFLPGAREVHAAAAEITARTRDVAVLPLYGAMPADEQDRALAPSAMRRVIVATNIAETSLTVPDVTAVVDTGYHKVIRYDHTRGIDSLQLERISLDAADQRAGRAGRLSSGAAIRLWHATDRLRRHREPDVARIDLAGPLLDILTWGGDPRRFEWFEAPPVEAVDQAMTLLEALGAIERGQLSALGSRMNRLSVHPRLARILIDAGGSYEAAVACAVLSDRLVLPQHPATTSNDLAGLADREASLPRHIREHARELHRMQRGSDASADFRRAVLRGYPDRVARRRGAGNPRVLMCSGYGAVVGAESGVREGEFLVAADLLAGRRGEGSEARIRIACRVEREWLSPDRIESRHELGADGVVRAIERELYGAVVLKERPGRVDVSTAAQVLADAFVSRPLDHATEQLVNRLRFAGAAVDLRALAERAATGRTNLNDVRLEDGVEWSVRRELDALAPETLRVPSGRNRPLDYRADGTVVLAVKLQELFGLASTPLIGPVRTPVVIELLAPNGRPVQTTRDLQNFWNTTYPEVRRELRGRYPKHPWPEDPWTAPPTARTRKASQS